jgi:hypothetical protein
MNEDLSELYEMTTTEPDRVRKVAEAIDPEHFDMSAWYENTEYSAGYTNEMYRVGDVLGCDTTACVAGWAVSTFPALVMGRHLIPDAAAVILGMDEDDALTLFENYDFDAKTAKDILMSIANNGDNNV